MSKNMSKKKNTERKSSKISVESYRFPFPYCVNQTSKKQSDEFLSEKICCSILKTQKNIVRGTKRLFICGYFGLSTINACIPSQAIGVIIFRPTAEIMTSLNANLSKQIIIDKAMKQVRSKIYFTEREISMLYDFSIEYETQGLTETELINKIRSLRGGAFIYEALFMILVLILIAKNTSSGFQFNNNAPGLPNWCSPKNNKPGQFGYGPSTSGRTGGMSQIRGMTQNAGSDKGNPASSSGSWEYVDIMEELDNQSNRRKIEIPVGNRIYDIKNPYRDNSSELQYVLAEEMYNVIRECDKDISDIAVNLGFKADNVKKVKDQVFFNTHDLDRYGEEGPRRRFDANLRMALAWKRLETGNHSPEDVMWLKHECAERHYELKYETGYDEAHEQASLYYPGEPWKDKYNLNLNITLKED